MNKKTNIQTNGYKTLKPSQFNLMLHLYQRTREERKKKVEMKKAFSVY